jgi:hypothetical protein
MKYLQRFFERRHGWAIDTGDGKLLSARFFRTDGTTPKHLHGLTMAVFRTRSDARHALKGVRRVIDEAVIVKVAVSYEAIRLPK